MSNIIHIDHLVVFVSDIKKTEDFYNVFLDYLIEKDSESVVYQIGATKLFLVLAEDMGGVFNKARVGLNHIAFFVAKNKLNEFVDKLEKANIKNSGIQKDKYSGNDFVWFDDPDGIRLEFYSRDIS